MDFKAFGDYVFVKLSDEKEQKSKQGLITEDKDEQTDKFANGVVMSNGDAASKLTPGTQVKLMISTISTPILITDEGRIAVITPMSICGIKKKSNGRER